MPLNPPPAPARVSSNWEDGTAFDAWTLPSVAACKLTTHHPAHVVQTVKSFKQRTSAKHITAGSITFEESFDIPVRLRSLYSPKHTTHILLHSYRTRALNLSIRAFTPAEWKLHHMYTVRTAEQVFSKSDTIEVALFDHDFLKGEELGMVGANLDHFFQHANPSAIARRRYRLGSSTSKIKHLDGEVILSIAFTPATLWRIELTVEEGRDLPTSSGSAKLYCVGAQRALPSHCLLLSIRHEHLMGAPPPSRPRAGSIGKQKQQTAPVTHADGFPQWGETLMLQFEEHTSDAAFLRVELLESDRSNKVSCPSPFEGRAARLDL
jgi:hypothetical protein